MTSPFAGFAHTSELSSIPHDPPISLASNAIRDFFGPMVQLVADGLQSRGGSSTLRQILHMINTKYGKKSMSTAFKADSHTRERREIIRVSKLQPMAARDSPSTPAVRAALLALIQHSIVTVKKSKSITPTKTKVVFHYTYHPERARLLPRYPRFVEYTKKALDQTAAALIEEILVNGRMSTVAAIVSTVEQLQQAKEATDSSRYTFRQAVLESFRRLVNGGFIKRVYEISDDPNDDDELEFSDTGISAQPPAKRRRISAEDETEDPAVLSMLLSGPYKILPRNTIWCVNIEMFHHSLRAVSMGWLVAERYGNKVQSAGSIVTAALKLAAYRKHAEAAQQQAASNSNSQQQDANDFEAQNLFRPQDITRYLPKTVRENFEKKAGGIIPNLFLALKDLSRCNDPSVVAEVEVADGRPDQAKFEISTRRIVAFLQDRIIHQIAYDSHGEVAARICSILRTHGHMESDTIAEMAMVPAKDTREVLHRLYRDNYISLFNMNQGKQHNPSNMFYLWSISRGKSLRNATDSVCTALLNMRLRRQHQVEVGKDWIERAKEAGATDENENEADKIKYTRFCQGLERLDNAALQLDETLMVLKDY